MVGFQALAADAGVAEGEKDSCAQELAVTFELCHTDSLQLHILLSRLWPCVLPFTGDVHRTLSGPRTA